MNDVTPPMIPTRSNARSTLRNTLRIAGTFFELVVCFEWLGEETSNFFNAILFISFYLGGQWAKSRNQNQQQENQMCQLESKPNQIRPHPNKRQT